MVLREPSAASLNADFMFYAEAMVEPLRSDGKRYSRAFSYDLMTPANGRRATELNLLTPQIVTPPGPFRLRLPYGSSIPTNVERWNYMARAVLMFGPNRKEFIVCASSPAIPEKSFVQPSTAALPDGLADNEILVTIENQDLVIDIRGAWRKIGYWLQSGNDLYDPSVKAEHVRIVAAGC
jgi:hypothetical protein